MASTKDTPAADTAAADEAPALALGDLVQLHDDQYALVVSAAVDDKPAHVVRLGPAQAYALDARRVLA